jgi:broad specificity phosphatase PhoE
MASSHTMPTGSLHKSQIVEAPAPSPAAAGRASGIVLARHAEPALSRKVRLSARQYRDWWALYEAGGILAGQSPPGHLKAAAERAAVIYSSTRLRSIETAMALASGRDFTRDSLFIEAPLPPPHWPDFIRLSPRHWGVISRIWWWFFGHHEGQETRAQAEVRAAEAATRLDEIARRDGDVLVVAHGFFNTMIGLELKKLGWRCVKGRGYKYWSTRYFEK